VNKATGLGRRWYAAIERRLAPTEQVADVVLVVLIGVSVWVLFQRSATLKAFWIAYWVSP
jgi:hypothetical protein